MNLSIYIANQLFLWLNRKVYRSFIKTRRNIQQKQIETLFKILAKNQKSDIGKKYHFSDIKTVEEYQQHVPVMDYEDYKPYIHDIMNGEKHILCMEKIKYLALSSGTVSPSKYIPFTDTLKDEFSKALNAWIYDLMIQYPKIKTGKQFWIVSPVTHIDSPESKVPVGFEPDSAYFGKIESLLIKNVMLVPDEVSLIKSSENYLYVISLFIMRERNISLISVWNPGILISIIQFIKKLGCLPKNNYIYLKNK